MRRFAAPPLRTLRSGVASSNRSSPAAAVHTAIRRVQYGVSPTEKRHQMMQLLRTTARASCSAAPSATTPRCAATRPGTATPAAAARRPGTCALGGRRQGGGAAERQLQPLRWTSDRERSSNVTAASMAWVRPLVLHLRRRPPRHRGRHTRRGE